MARLPALVSALAKVDGRDRTVIDFTARVVREGGGIQTTKRGSGAAPMTARDAANLLIGLHGADLPKDAASAVPQFRSLQRKGTGNSNGEDVFSRIDAASTFGEALEVAVAGGQEIAEALLAYIGEAHAEIGTDATGSLLLEMAGLTIALGRPRLHASITVWRSLGTERGPQHRWNYVMDTKLKREGFYGPIGIADRTITVEISHRTLLALSDALSA